MLNRRTFLHVTAKKMLPNDTIFHSEGHHTYLGPSCNAYFPMVACVITRLYCNVHTNSQVYISLLKL